MIEGGSHPWRGAIGRLSLDKRMSFAMSLFLYRKVLPCPQPSIAEYMERMSSESEAFDPAFLSYAKRAVRKMFPAGWDSVLYPNACLSATLPSSSCVQMSRAKGGCREAYRSGGTTWSSHLDYVVDTLARESSPDEYSSRVLRVETGGKWRIVSAADVDMNILRPLHSAIYNRLSRFSWLLRGEAKAQSFKKFTAVDGCVFVSGDYASATDNLNISVQEAILDGILEGARQVPIGVKECARVSQRMVMASDGLVVTQKRGQLMGNLLSFPLLCIVNYLGFRFYGGLSETRDLPVKVNGDDIVFRSSEQLAKKWMAGVKGSGLTLLRGKTMVCGKYFTLNSKLFKGTPACARLLPSLRSSAFGFKDSDDPVHSLAGRWRRVRDDFPCGRRLLLSLETSFLRMNARFVVASRRSVTRGLDMKFSPDALMATNLWKRECFYLNLGKEAPFPISPEAREKMRIPVGWECVRIENLTEEIMEESRKIGPEFIGMCWDTQPKEDGVGRDELVRSYNEAVALAPKYVQRSRGYARCSRLLKLSVQSTRRFLKPHVLMDGAVQFDPYKIVRSHRPRGKRVWLPAGFRPVNFPDNSLGSTLLPSGFVFGGTEGAVLA
jgi:hypothetical protein